MGNPLRDMENISNAYTSILEHTQKPFHQTPTQDKNSYSRPVMTTSPDKPINGGYSSSSLQPVESEEEEKKGNISRKNLSEFVHEEISKASMFGMDYAVMVLSELQKKFRL